MTVLIIATTKVDHPLRNINIFEIWLLNNNHNIYCLPTCAPSQSHPRAMLRRCSRRRNASAVPLDRLKALDATPRPPEAASSVPRLVCHVWWATGLYRHIPTDDGDNNRPRTIHGVAVKPVLPTCTVTEVIHVKAVLTLEMLQTATGGFTRAFFIVISRGMTCIAIMPV
jgi:hypothetical protein